MPVLFIEGPAGLDATVKRNLVKKTVAALFAAYQMPDDRVYMNECPIENGGIPAWIGKTGTNSLIPSLSGPS